MLTKRSATSGDRNDDLGHLVFLMMFRLKHTFSKPNKIIMYKLVTCEALLDVRTIK